MLNASSRSDIKKILDATPFPPGYRYSFGGSTKNMNESFRYLISHQIQPPE